jgi:hypothetical protein
VLILGSSPEQCSDTLRRPHCRGSCLRPDLLTASKTMTAVMIQVMRMEASAPRISTRWYPNECRRVARQLTAHNANREMAKPGPGEEEK